MIRVQAMSSATLPDGRVALDRNQALRRIQNLTVLKSGIYDIRRPIQFKKGERFGIEKIQKHMQCVLVEVDVKSTEGNS